MIHSLEFNITTFCQARCRACPRTNEETGKASTFLTTEHMSIDEFKRMLQNLNGMQLDEINFQGELGDPIMHPELELFVQVALEHTDHVMISTNAGLRTEKWWLYMGRKYRNRLSVKFAIDGASSKTNWLYREGVNWDRAMANMRAWFDGGTNSNGMWKFLIFDWNYHEIATAATMAEEVGCNMIAFEYNTRDFKNEFGMQGLITDVHKNIADDTLARIGKDTH